MKIELTNRQADELLEVIDFAMIENAEKLERGFLDMYAEGSAQRLQDNASKLARIVRGNMREAKK